jgi:hypothetical protein
MIKTVSAKMGIRNDMRAIFINAPEAAVDDIHPPTLQISNRLVGAFDYIHLFATREANVHKKFPLLKSHLKPTGMLWISWPKAGQQNTDLTLHGVIKIGYDHGLVESKTLSVNSTWSAIKFTHPKKGKVYKNKFGKLKK